MRFLLYRGREVLLHDSGKGYLNIPFSNDTREFREMLVFRMGLDWSLVELERINQRPSVSIFRIEPGVETGIFDEMIVRRGFVWHPMNAPTQNQWADGLIDHLFPEGLPYGWNLATLGNCCNARVVQQKKHYRARY